MTDLKFRGLDGSNLLAFLAALGTLRLYPDTQIHWVEEGHWVPVLRGDIPADESTFAEEAAVRLSRQQWFAPLDTHDDSNKIAPCTFRNAAQDSVTWAGSGQRLDWCDWVAAMGCDAISENHLIADTAFRTMSGAGHQHFLKSFRDLQLVTNGQQVREALFEGWRYADGKPGLRFDAAEDRRYALRWAEPSTDPIKTVRGANRLAVEALPLFPTVPVGSRLETTGFVGRGSKDTWVSWPIWSVPCSVDVVRSLLAHPGLHNSKQRMALKALGVQEVFRAQRLTLGKMRNFTPSVPL